MDKQEAMYGMAATGIVPVRKSPSDRSEMISQLLLGETIKVNREKDRAYHITADLDGYNGWINKNECHLLTKPLWEKWCRIAKNPSARSPFYTYRAAAHVDNRQMVPVGSVVHRQNNQLSYPFGTFRPLQTKITVRQSSILDTARQFLGTPYLWGGRTDTGIDCSGFIQTVLLLHGLIFPRDSSKQAKRVRLYPMNENELKAADIVYFSPGSDLISHVGFYLEDGLILHASGRVKIESIETGRAENSPFRLNKLLAGSVSGYQKMDEIKQICRITINH